MPTLLWDISKNPQYLLDSSVLFPNPIHTTTTTYRIKIEPNKSIRSIPQNRLYWGYFLKRIVEELKSRGIETDSESIHEELKGRFLSKRVKSKFSNRYIKKTFSTTKLNTKAFKEYMDRINEYLQSTIGTHIDLDISQADLEYYETLFF